ncbi:MAG: TIGR02444 family protein, partial [Pseudomonadota bacterium]
SPAGCYPLPMVPEPLPAFAEALYARHGVREACLQLQDEGGCDVTLLLAAAWLGRQGRVASPADWAAVAAELTPWREGVVAPLRGVRRHLKLWAVDAQSEPGVEAIREQVRAAELAAEFRALAWLEGRLADAVPGHGDAVAANLAAVVGDGAPTAALAALRGAAREAV